MRTDVTMRWQRRTLFRIIVLMLVLPAGACVRQWSAAPPPTLLNSPRFVERPGRPDYATTVRYIDDHVRYEDSDTGFAIWPNGDLCYFYELRFAWCIPPKTVGHVGIDRYVEVHCSKWFPDCAYKLSGGPVPSEYANQVQVRERFEDRAALMAGLNHLLYLMGGPDLSADPFAARAAAPGG